MVEVEEQGAIMMNPITFVYILNCGVLLNTIKVYHFHVTYTPTCPVVLQFLASYGWLLVGVSAAVLYALHKLRPRIHIWKEAREDALYHKDPDATLARLQAVQDARERQQRAMEEASLRALELQKEREEARRDAAASRRERRGGEQGEGGQRLGGDGNTKIGSSRLVRAPPPPPIARRNAPPAPGEAAGDRH